MLGCLMDAFITSLKRPTEKYKCLALKICKEVMTNSVYPVEN